MMIAFTIPGQPVPKGSISAERVAELLDYRPETGVFTWRKRRSTARAGDVAGTVDRKGYIRVRIDGMKHAAHRLAWLVSNGPIPDGLTIDHINGDKADNRIANLRLASNAENQRNKTEYANSKTGMKGVFWNPAKRRYSAAIRKDGRLKHLGYFDNKDAAARAYASAATVLHGEFKNLGSAK